MYTVTSEHFQWGLLQDWKIYFLTENIKKNANLCSFPKKMIERSHTVPKLPKGVTL